MAAKKKRKYAISVSGRTYAALQRVVPSRGVAKAVDGLILSALEDPTFLARLNARYPYVDEAN